MKWNNENNPKYSHGMAGTKIHAIWCDMVARCNRKTHPRYSDYGGRGLTVSDSWREFENFYKDMGERPEGMSLDRVNNDLGYSRENCRWASLDVQAQNKRNNVKYTVGDRTGTASFFAKLCGANYELFRSRCRSHGIEYAVLSFVGSVGLDQLEIV